MRVRGRFFELVVAFAAISGISASAEGKTVYYDHSERPGYYGYHDPELEKPEEQQKKQPIKQPVPKERRLPKLSDYTPTQLWNMHPDDFEALERDFMKKAVQAPSVENVEEHLYIKDMARRKALAYTNSYMVALQKNPDLSLEKDMPLAAGARAIKYRETEKERMSKLVASRDDFAIIYFSSPSCSYCVEQDKTVGYFTGRTRWTVKKVDIEQNRGLASRFGISRTPTLLLIRRGMEEYFPLTSGIISLNELEDRVYMGVRLLNKETSPENYTTREFQRGGGLDSTAPLGR